MKSVLDFNLNLNSMSYYVIEAIIVIGANAVKHYFPKRLFPRISEFRCKTKAHLYDSGVLEHQTGNPRIARMDMNLTSAPFVAKRDLRRFRPPTVFYTPDVVTCW